MFHRHLICMKHESSVIADRGKRKIREIDSLISADTFIPAENFRLYVSSEEEE